MNSNFESSVAMVETGAYGDESVARAIDRLWSYLRWENLIPPGARVLIKPNFVLHHNQGDGGMDPMITHQSVVKAVAHAALKTEASEVIVGDAPIQTADFDALLEVTGLGEWAETLKNADSRFKGVKDFRRTTARYVNGVRVAEENVLPEDA